MNAEDWDNDELLARDEAYLAHRRVLSLAEERLGYLETMLRNVSADKRQRTRQKLLRRSVNRQYREVDTLRLEARRLRSQAKTRATRYVRAVKREDEADSARRQETQA